MPLTTKTRDEMEQMVRALLRNLIPDADVSALSDYDITARIAAAVFLGNQQQAEFLLRQILPTAEADLAFVELHARIIGTSKLPAARSEGKVLLVSPDTDDVQPAGSELVHGDGTKYTTRADATTHEPSFTGKTVGAGSTDGRIFVNPNVTGFDVDDALTIDGNTRVVKAVLPNVSVIDLYHPLPSAPTVGGDITAKTGVVAHVDADEPGEQGNKPTSDTLTLSSPADNIEATATVLELTGGGDEETKEQLAARVASRMGNRPASGNAADYRAWTLETPDVRVEEAFVFPGLRGLGTIDVYPVGFGRARIPGRATLDAITAYVRSKAGYADDVRVSAFGYDTPPVDLTLTVTTRVGFEPDWSGSRFVDTGSDTTTVFVTTNPLFAIEPGDRVLVPVVSAGLDILEERKVDTVTSDFIVLASPLSAAPAVGETIRPSGPNGQDIVDAITELFDRLGPSTDLAIRVPSPAEGFDDTLRVSAMIAAVMGVDGVANVTVTSPASDQQPTVTRVVQLGQISLTLQEG